jgi:hypothetical protein
VRSAEVTWTRDSQWKTLIQDVMWSSRDDLVLRTRCELQLRDHLNVVVSKKVSNGFQLLLRVTIV